MRSNHAYWRVYWAGAAIAMKLDVEIRRVTGGRRSLDDVMRHWSRRVGSDVDVSAADLIADADTFLGTPMFAHIATPALASSAFPDVTPCYRWLGLVVGDGFVSTVPAEGASERERIVASPALVPGTPLVAPSAGPEATPGATSTPAGGR